LNEDYEFAPENTVLKKFYQLNSEHLDAADGFYQTREFLHTVFFESYLFYPDIKRRLDQDVSETIENLSEEEPQVVMGYVREVTEAYTFSKSSALLALNAKDWASAVVGETDAHYKALSSISQKVKGLFLYKSQTETDVTLEHIASGMLFEMTKKSFDPLEDLKEDYIIYIGLVKYDGEWWFSGNFSASPFDADLILDEKNSAKSRSEVSFLEDQAQMASIMEQQQQAFLDFNQGSLVAFLSAADLNPFLEAYMTFFNDSLKLSDQEKEDVDKRTKADGYFGNTAKEDPLEGEDKVFVVYFNPKSGIEFYDDIINAFPDERNSFFTEESREDVQYILMSATCSTEFTNYFVEHYKDRLDYFKSEPYKSYLNDLDFLLRFWKKDNYHTKSTVVLTGKDGQ
jgi:predicted house-cleaning noncanonical NTP pyrophosphatase (MazG superfamily)